MNLFNQLYALESTARKSHLSKEKLLNLRQTQGTQIFKELSSTIHELSENSIPGSNLYKAAQYFMKHEDGLHQYLGNAEVPIDNNACERAVKVFVMSRKNFLFSNTEVGAESTAMYFTLLESAVLNGLDPEKYLEFVLNTFLNERMTDEVKQRLLLFSGELPEELYVTMEV